MVYLTRSKVSNMEAFTTLIDTKLTELRQTLLLEFKAALDAHVEEKKVELTAFVNLKMVEDVPSSNELKESIKEIQKHVSQLRADNLFLKNRVDDLQQYIRRQNVRIFGVPVKHQERSKDVEELVKKLITDSGISEFSLDRAHRIGKKKKAKNNDSEEIEVQPIIARLTTFRDRTVFYQARKNVKEAYGYGVSLDLTKDRLALLKQAREMVKEVDGIKFAYSDINCQLRVLTSTGKHWAFDTKDDLDVIIASVS